ncbi:MAG: helix-turn-helix transcriptional regulator [Sphingomonadales bacterium]|nr:helix-turn-helix transcriptional regulator [Sphingomonadales bacterium]
MASGADNSDFVSLTDKQTAVLTLLANGRTSKEIATTLDLSESAVNRRIELLRSRFGGITRLELARRYRDWAAGVETDRQSLRLAPTALPKQDDVQDGRDAVPISAGPIAKPIAPLPSGADEPRFVPRVLDGENAALTRGAAIAIILAGIIASLVLGLAAAEALTEALGN